MPLALTVDRLPWMLIVLVTSRSPVAAAFSPAPAIDRVYVAPEASRIVLERALGVGLLDRRRAASTSPSASAHTPLPGAASTESLVLLTVKLAASADGAASSGIAKPMSAAPVLVLECMCR